MTHINYGARLCPPNALPQGIRTNRCWYITFGLGSTAAKTFTRVEVQDNPWRAIHAEAATAHPEAIIDDLVRRLATDLYGDSWANVYRPEQADDSVFRHYSQIREHVFITFVEVWS